MARKNVTPVLETMTADDEAFLTQVEEFIDKGDFLYLSSSHDVLVDRQMIPVFDIKEAKYGVIAQSQYTNGYTILANNANTIVRLMKIIKEQKEVING